MGSRGWRAEPAAGPVGWVNGRKKLVSLRLIGINKLGGWKDGSVFKSTECSFRRPKLIPSTQMGAHSYL